MILLIGLAVVVGLAVVAYLLTKPRTTTRSYSTGGYRTTTVDSSASTYYVDGTGSSYDSSDCGSSTSSDCGSSDAGGCDGGGGCD